MESFTQMRTFKIGSAAFNLGGQLISLGAVKLIYTFRQKFRNQKLCLPIVRKGLLFSTRSRFM